MFSSARDLLRFGLFHIGHPQPGQKAILKPESLAEMQRITMYAQPGRGAGVGWRMLEDDMGYRSVGHDGGMGGVQTLLRMLPETGSVAVALCNSSKPSPPVPYGLAEELFSGLLPDYAERYEQRKREGFVAGSQVPPATPPGDLPAKLTGTWRGSVSTMAGERPFTLWVKGCGDIIAEYNGQLRSLVNNVGYQNGQLTGDFLGNIDTPDWEGLPHQLRIDMRWRGGDRLNGAILAMSPLQDSGLPGRRIGHCLNHWVDLERVEE
ncbi:MAG: hypothetical protein DCC58_04175 [Chloroflexi bacterium]|nr:MAG: hypothetical protein DCC58_04175 [Chloroflexota bacterium]